MNIFRYLDRWLSAPSFWAMWTAMEARKIVMFVSNLVMYGMYSTMCCKKQMIIENYQIYLQIEQKHDHL
jgi:hypothetical protein